MKKYFAKYLPVEGEIKTGDKFIDSGVMDMIGTAHVPNDYSNPYVPYYDGYQKVKLFLCSRDIQVGDDAIDNVDRRWNNVEQCWVTAMRDRNEYHNNSECFSVIGEVSPKAVWVEEWMEFEEDDIELVNKDISSVPKYYDKSFASWDIIRTEEYKFIKFKRPNSNTFH